MKKGIIFLLFYFFVLIVTLSGVEASAQMFDSIQSSFHKNCRLIGGFSTKTTFISGFQSPIFTVRAGLKFNDLVTVGAGVSWLQLSPYNKARNNDPFYLDKQFSDAQGNYTVHPELNFRYVDVFFEYVYYRNKKWQFSVPLQVGAGDSWYSYNFNGLQTVQDRHFVLLYEPAVSGTYKIIPWLGVGLDVGLRIMVVTNKNIGTKFDSPMYSVGMVVFWGEVYKSVFRRGE